VSYEDINSQESIKKFGVLLPPAIVFEDHILTEGHVPIMKKLALELYKIVGLSKSKA